MIRIFLASPPTFAAHVAFVEDQVPSLLGVANWVGTEVCMPKIVEDELDGQYVRSIEASYDKLNAAATHSICWTTWPTKYDPKRFAYSQLEKYDAEIHLLLTNIVGARVVLAALSPSVHGQLSPLLARLYDIDVRMGEAKALFGEDMKGGLAALTKIHAASVELDDQLLKEITRLNFDSRPPEMR
jgi:hypothetical protein